MIRPENANVYQVVQTTITDLDLIFSFFDSAIAYQEKKGYDLWPRFSEQMIIQEINNGNSWKITEGTHVLCVFSVLYNDPVIWLERNRDPSVYLHRIAVNPKFKGKRLMNVIRLWAMQHAIEKGKKFVRMDTWGNNLNIREYYINCGFKYIGQQHLLQNGKDPQHYGGSLLSLFQLEV